MLTYDHRILENKKKHNNMNLEQRIDKIPITILLLLLFLIIIGGYFLVTWIL